MIYDVLLNFIFHILIIYEYTVFVIEYIDSYCIRMYISDIGSMTNEEIKQLHKKYSHGKYKDEWFDIVWTHSNIVLKIAQKIVSNLKKKEIFVNEEILHAGVLLHDIGVYSLIGRASCRERV